MKKILGLVIMLLVIWAAGLLYAGHKTEKLISQYVNQTNKVYQQTGIKIELELRQFDSNLFGAKAQYAVKIDIHDIKDQLELNLELDEDDMTALEDAFKTPFIINQDIQYGPVFFDEGLEFAMAKTSLQSTFSNFVKGILEFKQGNEKQLGALISNIKQVLEKEVVLEFNIVLPLFSNKIKTTGFISEIRINNKGDLLVIDKMTFDSATNSQNILTGQSNVNIPNITFKAKDGTSMSIKGISEAINNSFDGFGKVKYDIQKLDVKSPKEGNTSLSISAFIEINKNKAPNLSDIKASVKLEVFKYPKQVKIMPYDLPRVIQLSWSLNGINYKEFIEIFRKLKNLSSAKGSAKTVEPSVYFLDNLDRFLVKNVSNFNFNGDITTTKQPKIHNTLDLTVTYDFGKGEVKKLLKMDDTEAGEFAKDKVSANLKIKVNTDTLKEFQPMLAMPISQGILEEKHNFYQTNANYQKGKLMVNGKDMSAILQQLKPK